MAPLVEEVVLLLCDRVTRDPKSSKTALNGVFDRVLVTNYPGSISRCTIASTSRAHPSLRFPYVSRSMTPRA